MLSTSQIMFKRQFPLEMLNLGRIIENPALLAEFESKDFSDPLLRMLIEKLKSNGNKTQKEQWLEEYLLRIGCKPWRMCGEDRKENLTEGQKVAAEKWRIEELKRKLPSAIGHEQAMKMIEEAIN
jgi:hypothetical protein